MKPPKCRSCGVEEWRHVCAPPASAPVISRVTRKELVRKTAPRAKPAVAEAAINAINTAQAINAEVSHVAINARPAGKESGAGAKLPNGRDRAAYNDYMRKYMRARRAVGKQLKDSNTLNLSPEPFK